MFSFSYLDSVADNKVKKLIKSVLEQIGLDCSNTKVLGNNDTSVTDCRWIYNKTHITVQFTIAEIEDVDSVASEIAAGIKDVVQLYNSNPVYVQVKQTDINFYSWFSTRWIKVIQTVHLSKQNL